MSADPDEWDVVAAGPTGGNMMGRGLSFSTALRGVCGERPAGDDPAARSAQAAGAIHAIPAGVNADHAAAKAVRHGR